MPRAWPTPADFQEAIQAPHLVFTDPDLKAARPELGPLGLPRPRAGGFAVVFRMQSGRQSWAVKCFTREFEDQQRRYSAVAKALGAASLGFIANFQFLPHGMLVRGRTYPILKMEWFDGEDFKAYIQRHLRDAAALDKLASQFLDMTLALRNAAIAHGDLQDRNILVVRDCIRLIDYDGMYVPALAGMGSHELGARHYQHPHRNYRHFAPYLDNFPTWVIYLSLISLAVQPDLWHQFGGDDDERLLFRREDFEKPEHSPLINALERSPSPRVQELARQFKRLAGMPLDQIPSLDGNLSHHTAPTAYPDQNWWRDHVVHPATPSPRLSESSIRRDASADGINRPGRALLRSGHLLLPTGAVAQIVVPTLSVLTSVLLVILFQAAAIGLDMLAGTTTLLMVSNLVFFLARHRQQPALPAITKAIDPEAVQMRAQIDRLTREKDAARKRMSERKEIIERKRTELIDRQRADLAAAEAAGKRELQAIDHRRSAAVHEHTRKLQGVRTVLGSKLAAVDSKFTELDRAETDALGDALLMVRERYFRDYLLSIELCSAEIPKIPGSMLRRLGSYGYKFVSDIDSNLTKVPGIGPVRAQALLDWRLTQEAAVRRASPSALPEDEERDVRAKYALERRKLEDERHQWKEELAWQEAQLGDQNRAVHVEMDKEEQEIREGLKPKVAAIRLRFDQELSALDAEEARVIREHDQELRRLEEEILQMQSKLARVQHG